MECNKDEAIRAKNIAENKMTKNDFEGARKLALKAQKLFPELENISQILTVCDVHCSSQKKINNSQIDLYGILQVENLADEVTIKKQYRKLALVLHPDKNKFPGAESAFKLICEANMILSDKGKRYLYDFKCKEFAKDTVQTPQNQNPHGSQNPGQKSKPDSNGRSTFWVNCPFCKINYEYDKSIITKEIRCPKCFKIIRSTEPPNRGAGGSNHGSDTVRSVQEQVGKSTKRTHVGDEKIPGKKSKVSSSENDSKSNSDLKDDVGKAVYIDCKEPEFTNFDKEKEKDCFEVDQIWACYDPIDGMPRFYAIIRKVYKSGFRVRITWLEADPDNPPEIKWAEEGLPVSCGKFLRGETEETQDNLMFSHRIQFSTEKKKTAFLFNLPEKRRNLGAF
ncbi:hypothetical protein L2E82_49619 [Cichorium intybus]|uniref:Uncharacterized protein n=1 Tax=Cichorium intybus TaxID=13427 RepID=A0ACB8YZY5_CICIN|nr:hypothetical protein L2E82_49619 [Cichorium intybus]